jgi:hypothetical protein
VPRIAIRVSLIVIRVSLIAIRVSLIAIRVPPTKPFRRVSTDRVQRNRSNSCGFIRSATV